MEQVCTEKQIERSNSNRISSFYSLSVPQSGNPCLESWFSGSDF